MKIKKKHVSIFAVVALLGIIMPLKVDYKVYTTGKVFAEKEWTLCKTEDGRITSTIKDNQLGVIRSYGGKEFSRGDVFDFYVDSEILDSKYVKKGEKIGGFHSNDLERMLVELEGGLKVEKALLGVYSTGEKTQIVNEGEKALKLAREQFEIQKKLWERKKDLYDDSLIAPQEYEIALNAYETSKINYELAHASLSTISTGEKPEQIRYSREKIKSLENQIKNLKERLNGLKIIAPFAGMFVHKKPAPSIITTNTPFTETLVNLIDTSTFIIITPVQLKDLKYINVGTPLEIQLYNSDCMMHGEVSHIDNGIQVVNGKQAVYVTATIKQDCPETLPGIIAQTTFDCGELTVMEYLQRFVNGLFYR